MSLVIHFVLVETTHSGNIGAAARAMKTMGFGSLRLVAPCKYQTAEALARASGADEIVTSAAVFSSVEDAVADCAVVYGTSARSRSLEWSVVSLEQAAIDIVDPAASATAGQPGTNADTATGMQAAGSIAIVFGRERSGLTNDELALCNYRLNIPTNPDFSSLNLGSAVQVVAYELYRQMLGSRKSPMSHPAISESATAELGVDDAKSDDPLAESGALENLFQHLQQTMEQADFLDPDNPRLLMKRVRRFFMRSRPTRSEVQIWRGFLTAIDKKLR